MAPNNETGSIGNAGVKVELKLTSNVSMEISIGNCQDQGARPYQEDSFGYSNIFDSGAVSTKGLFAILSDGMGGLSNGRAVADYVVQKAISLFDSLNPRLSISEQLKNLVGIINSGVCDTYIENSVSKAGATMVLAYIFKNRIYWVTVGDSRLYCLRNGHLLQMNEDHDYKNQLYRDYIETESVSLEEVESNPQKDSLVCFIGKQNIPYIDVSVKGYRIRPGDIYVLCSDGIYNGISSETMKEILLGNDPQTASEKIVSNIRGAQFPGQDNMTVMVIKCDKKY